MMHANSNPELHSSMFSIPEHKHKGKEKEKKILRHSLPVSKPMQPQPLTVFDNTGKLPIEVHGRGADVFVDFTVIDAQMERGSLPPIQKPPVDSPIGRVERGQWHDPHPLQGVVDGQAVVRGFWKGVKAQGLQASGHPVPDAGVAFGLVA